MLFRNPCKNLESYDNPFWKNSDGGRKREREKEEEKKSMIIVVPSCLKDADGARTRSDQLEIVNKDLIHQYKTVKAYNVVLRT